jgi:hypothetical protein
MFVIRYIENWERFLSIYVIGKTKKTLKKKKREKENPESTSYGENKKKLRDIYI